MRVNFGIFAGREATQAEVDRLGFALYEDLQSLAISAVRRHELGDGQEAVVHQVVVEASTDEARDGAGADELAERVRARAEEWAADCVADRCVEPLEG